MTRTTTPWLGWTVLVFNGLHLVYGLVAGEAPGFGGLVNPDRAPSLTYEPGWYVAILGIYLVLTILGLYLVMRESAPESPAK